MKVWIRNHYHGNQVQRETRPDRVVTQRQLDAAVGVLCPIGSGCQCHQNIHVFRMRGRKHIYCVFVPHPDGRKVEDV